MADDGTPKKPIEGQVLPKEDDAKKDLAEVQEQTAIIRAIGEQLKTIAETPGVSAYLGGLGEAMSANAKLAAEAQKNQHELAMLQEKNGAASRRRLELSGAVLLPILGTMAAGCIFGLAWMIHAEIVTKESALTMGVILTGIFGWMNTQRQKSEKK